MLIPGMGRQVTCRVSEAVKKAFGVYAGRFGLDDSQMAKLLIRRELCHRQLAAFAASGGNVDPIPHSSPSKPPKITAHFPSPTEVAEFDAYAASCGLGRGKAAAWILERELQERWLEKAFSRPPDPDEVSP